MNSSAQPGPNRFAAAAELAAFFGLLELEQWVLVGESSALRTVLRAAAWAGVAVVVVASHVRRRPAEPPAAAARAWAEAGLATAVMAGLLVGGAWSAGLVQPESGWHIFGKPQLAGWMAVKVAVAAVQQLALQLFLYPVCRELTGATVPAVVAAAALFGLMHVPNWALVGLCFAAGLVWFTLYLRSRRLLPMVASHVLLVVLVRAVLPQHVHYNLGVGAAMLPLKAEYDGIRSAGEWERFARLASADFYAAAGNTDDGFVRSLYPELLGRGATEEEVTFWVRELARRLRADVVRQFFVSGEYRRAPAGP